MNHHWQRTRFYGGKELPGVGLTTVQCWRCWKCEKEIETDCDTIPKIPGECKDTRSERADKELLRKQIEAKSPQGWGNGNKARKKR